ncbi:MAG: ABC transporter ATP-binding protein [Candidatus Omnitrophota bacterium]
MLKRIEFCFNHQRFVNKRKAVDFSKGINLVIGANGSGKSSLLRAIHECRDCKRIESGSTKYHHYDGELMNPHRKNMRGNSLLRVRAMFSSHGETMRDVLASIPLGKGDTLLLDEPESGQDVEWMIRIRRGFKEVARLGCQLIVATHHPVFIENSHIIELQSGYRKKLNKIYKDIVTRNAKS